MENWPGNYLVAAQVAPVLGYSVDIYTPELVSFRHQDMVNVHSNNLKSWLVKPVLAFWDCGHFIFAKGCFFVGSVRNLVAESGGMGGAFRKVPQIIKQDGAAGILQSICKVFGCGPGVYQEWINRYDTLTDTDRQRIRDEICLYTHAPKISLIMPVYDPPVEFLDATIWSVRKQLYTEWELCIADDASKNQEVRAVLKKHADADGRIRIAYRKENGHISAASNTALSLASGYFVALMDNDDLLPEYALYYVAKVIMKNPDVALIYSDEDKVTSEGQRINPYFKCDWNVDLFRSQNMICHLGVYKAELVNSIGGFRVGYEGAQDYDLAARIIERIEPRQIVHIPRVLYHWRAYPGSTALAVSEKKYAQLAGVRVLQEHLDNQNVSAKVEPMKNGMYRIRYDLPEKLPLVSLIIPTRNSLHLIQPCIDSILAKTKYKNYEIIVVDNGSDDEETLDYFNRIETKYPNIKIFRDNRPFNYSALNNAAVAQAHGSYVGLLNNDLEIISPDWLDEMIGIATQPGVGAVGACLWYPDNTLQHGGVITGIMGLAGHAHRGLPRGEDGYYARACVTNSFSVVTGACLIVKKSIYDEVHGLDEQNLSVAFNDVDFCLKVRKAGYRNVWTPHAELYHYESASRGLEDTSEKKARFIKEFEYMHKKWGDYLNNDPAYNPNLTLDHEDFRLAFPPLHK